MRIVAVIMNSLEVYIQLMREVRPLTSESNIGYQSELRGAS